MKRSNAFRLAAILSVFAVMSAFAGCAKSDNTQTSTTSAESSAGSTVSTESTASKDESKASSSEGTGLVGKWVSEEYNGDYDMMGSVMDLTYTIDSDTKMTISFLAEGYSPMTLTYSLEGNKLTLNDSLGTKNVFIRQ